MSRRPEVLFLINALSQVPGDSTRALIDATARQATCWVGDPAGLRWTPSGIEVAAVPVPEGAQLSAALDCPRAVKPASELSAVWVRLNPGRAPPGSLDGVSEALLALEASGGRVRNRASGLVRAASKLYLGTLPAGTVPATWSGRDPGFLLERVQSDAGPWVVKPATGTRGEGVRLVKRGDEGLESMLDELVARGPVLVQAYVPEAPQGDVRVHVVGGVPLEVDGRAAVVRRVPASGEWRSNVALGGRPEPATLTESVRGLVAQVGPQLCADGLWHVGLDVVGDRIVECNVYSPGGLVDAEHHTGAPFVEALVAAFTSELD